MSRNPRLRLVAGEPSHAVSLAGSAKKTWQGEDDTFFHKSQIRIGTRLLFFGRTDHGAIWEVIEIKTYRMVGKKPVPHKVDQVQKLLDDVVLRRAGGNVIRLLSFSGLTYSAVWRIAP